jgi:cation transport ATPase
MERRLTRRYGIGTIVNRGTTILFVSISPVVALVVLNTNSDVNALPFSSKPTLVMKLIVVIAAWPCAVIIAINGPVYSHAHDSR